MLWKKRKKRADMDELNLRIRLDEGAKAPRYASALAAGADVFAHISDPLEIAPGERSLVATGVYLELPPGYEAQVRPRSGLAWKHGITVLNAPGTVDADYRGELKVILINHGRVPWTVRSGERIAQLVVQPVVRADFTISETISDTPRGAGGFGSTGR